jgi:excinuclease ABC subunit B
MFNFENNCFPRNARRSGTNQSHLIASTAEEETRYDNIDNTNNGIVAEELIAYSTNGTSTIERSIEKLIEEARAEMETAAKNLDFMAATKHRDRMYELQKLREQEKLGDMYDKVRKAK